MGMLYNRASVWTDEERSIVAEMYGGGCSDEEISARIGRTIKAIERQRSLMGLVKKNSSARRSNFKISSATLEYWPTWYKRYLRKQWEKANA